MGWGSIVGSAIGAATSLFGVNKSAKSQSAANAANMALAREQMQYQKDLAQNQVQWRVEDAKKAGLHPLAALGVSPMSYSPVQGTAVGADYSGLNGVGDSLAQMGQNIDAHVMNAKTKQERAKALALQDQQIGLSLRHQELNNQILEMELASRRAKLFQNLVPGAPSTGRGVGVIPGQGESVSSSLTKVKPIEIIASDPSAPWRVPGSERDVGFKDTSLGGKAPFQVLNDKENEENFLANLGWSLRNLIGPYFGSRASVPPKSELPDKGRGGYTWEWSGTSASWIPVKRIRSAGDFFRGLRNTWLPFWR